MTVAFSHIALDWKGVGTLTLRNAGVTYRGQLVEVPYRSRDGSLWNTRVVDQTGRRWWRPKGRQVTLLGLEQLPTTCRVEDILFVLEGESDTLAVRDAIATLDDRRVFAVGLPGAATWKPTWAEHLRAFATVYLAGDGDAAGQSMAARIRADVPWARPLWLPIGQDTRSILQSDPEVFLDLIRAADENAVTHAAIVSATSIDACRELIGGASRG